MPGSEHQGQGYGVESVQELVSIAFELGGRRIEAGCFAENAPSRRLMQKVWLRQEGYYVQDALHRDGSWRNGTSYALLAQEWSALQRPGPPRGPRVPSVSTTTLPSPPRRRYEQWLRELTRNRQERAELSLNEKF